MCCFINGSLFTEVLPLSRCWTFLKANYSPGLQTCFEGMWICAQCAGGPLCEVFSTRSTCTCTESSCSAVIASAEGVVVLTGACNPVAVGTVLESYWHCTALCLFCMLFRIWKTFNVSLPVLCGVLLPIFAEIWYIFPFYHIFLWIVWK